MKNTFDIPKSTDYILLYAAADESYKMDVESHFRVIYQEQRLASIKIFEVSKFYPLKEDVQKLINKTTTIICLVSHAFLSSEFGLSSEFKKIMEGYRKDKTRIIPILLDHSRLTSILFNKTDFLASNDHPLADIADHRDYHKKLRTLVTDVHALILKAKTFEDIHENSWEQTLKDNTISAYSDFMKLFYYSKYVPLAKNNQDQLKDEKLWKEAQSFGTMEFYIDYLSSEVKNKKYREEAIEKIREIETDEGVEKEDMEKADNLGLLMRYKIFNGKEGARDKVNQKIRSIFITNPLDNWFESKKDIQGREEEENIETQTHQLRWKIFENGTPNEVFTYQLLEDSYNLLGRTIKNKKNRLINERGSTLFLLRILLLFLLFIPAPLTLAMNDFFHIFFTFISKPLHAFVLIIGISSLAFAVYWYLKGLQKDVDKCEEKIKELESQHTLLKIAFITHQPIEKANSVFALNNMEEWYLKFNEKKFLDYFFGEWEQDNEQKKEHLFITNKIHGG